MKESTKNKDILQLNLSVLHSNEGGKVGNGWFITLNGKGFSDGNVVRLGITYRPLEARLMLITSGRAKCYINLIPVELIPGKLLFIAPGSIFEVAERDEDFNFMAFSFIDLTDSFFQNGCREAMIKGQLLELVYQYFKLLWAEACQEQSSKNSVKGIQWALLGRLRTAVDFDHPVHYADLRINLFLELVNQHAIHHRDIAFYADKLCVTPNHLGFMVKKMSGSTVVEWINRHILQEAKVELKFTDRPITDIAYRLNFSTPSFFAKFFKRETGMTPLEYRRK